LELLEIAGAGGMGEVWRAHHGSEQIPVAVKVMSRAKAGDPRFKAAFANEVRAVARLNHPGIISVLDYGQVTRAAAKVSEGALIEGTPYLVMEWVEGSSLRGRSRLADWPTIRGVLLGILDALAYAHARDVIHRDLSLANVLLRGGSHKQLKLIDFGLAALPAGEHDEPLSKVVAGTPAFLAPEQILSWKWDEQGPATDLYALGVIAHYLLCGRLPFVDPDPAKLQAKQLTEPTPKLVPIVEAPEGLGRWVGKLMRKEPQQRFLSAADAAWALTHVDRWGPLSPANRGPALNEGQGDATLTDIGVTLDTLLGGPCDHREFLDTPPPQPAVTDNLEFSVPIPWSWRREEGTIEAQLIGAGLGLHGLRTVPFVGRERERDQIWETLRRIASSGRSEAFILAGSAGCGKSRLAEWIGRRAREVGSTTVLHAFHSATPSESMGLPQMVAEWLGCVGMSREDVNKHLQNRLVDRGQTTFEQAQILADTVCPVAVSEATKPRDRAVVYDAILALIRSRSGDRAAIVCLDDVQWGADALKFVDHALRSKAQTPVLFLATLRSDSLQDRPDEAARLIDLSNQTRLRRVEIPPLNQSEAEELASNLLILEPGLGEELRQRAAGNPLFITQLLDDWIRRGVLEAGSRGFRLREGEAAKLPDSLRDIWRQRLERLLGDVSKLTGTGYPELQRALEIAALLGRRVNPAEWRSACEAGGTASPPELVDHLLKSRLAVAEPPGWSFVHGMLVESLGQSAREAGHLQAAHLACARALEAAQGDHAGERVARHLLAGGRPEEALPLLTRAATAQFGNGNIRRAEALLAKQGVVVQELALSREHQERVHGWILQAKIQRWKGNVEAAARWGARAEAVARRRGWLHLLPEILATSTAPGSKTVLPPIPGLEIEREIGTGAHSVVYLARKGDSRYAVKFLKSQEGRISSSAVRTFRRETALVACLRHPAIPSILELDESAGRPYLVRQYVEGESLHDILDRGRVAESTLLNVAETVAAALAEIHRRGLVHRDVKPGNIIIEPSGDAKLIDFGLATRIADQERSEKVAGTFRYSAPEQTGMLDRPVDGRADLYSLGVVLFHCAAGHPPFLAEDPVELVRQHATLSPPDLRRIDPSLSPCLCMIVERLLAKDPDDRYQSGEELRADFRQLARLDSRIVAGEQISLGQSSYVAEPTEWMPLLGRDSELADLREQWQRARAGKGSAVLVAGEPGSGKSRLVRELRFEAQRMGGTALSGKCVEQDRLPFGPIKNALESYAARILRLPDAARERAEEQLRIAAGEFAPRLRRFTAGLARILSGTSNPRQAPDLPFYDLVTEFLLRLADVLGPTIFFIDDVQWLDDATRQVVLRVLDRIPHSKLLFVGAGRNDAESAVLTERFGDDCGPCLSARLNLTPLGDSAVKALLTHFFGGQAIDPVFSKHVALRANGNPFAVGEFVRATLDAGLVRPHWGEWVVDTTGLEQMELPTDVVQLVVKRITDLAPSTRTVLTAAAVLGSRFRLAVLAPVVGLDFDLVAAAIAEATSAHLIERDMREYAFVHDRVREALLAPLDTADLVDLHQQAAITLEQVVTGELDEIYALAQHYGNGRVVENPDRVFETNFEAGRAALENYADEEAFCFLETAAAAGEMAGRRFDAVFNGLRGAACARTDRLIEAAGYFATAIEQTATPLERAQLRVRLARVHLANHDSDLTWDQCRNALAETGRPFPKSMFGRTLRAIMDWARGVIVGRLRWGYGSASGGARERLRIQAEAFHVGTHAAYFELDAVHWLQLALSSLYPANRVGQSVELANAYCSYGGALASLKMVGGAARYTDLATSVATELGDRQTLARTKLWQGVSCSVSGRCAEAVSVYDKVIEEHGTWLHTADYLSIVGDHVFNHWIRGYAREARTVLTYLVAKLRRTRTRTGGIIGHPLLSLQLAIMPTLGKSGEAAQYIQDAKRLAAEHPDHRFRAAMLGLHLTAYYLEREEYGQDMEEAMALFRSVIPPLRLTLHHYRSFYVYYGYICLNQLLEAPDGELIGRIESLEGASRELSITHRQCARLSVSLAGNQGVPETVQGPLSEGGATAEASPGSC